MDAGTIIMISMGSLLLMIVVGAIRLGRSKEKNKHAKADSKAAKEFLTRKRRTGRELLDRLRNKAR